MVAPTPTITLRPVQPSDGAALSSICLLTGDAGNSAADKFSPQYHEIIGIFWALPYIHPALAATTFGFVLETDAGEVVGYALGSAETPRFELEKEKKYWPPLRAKFPPPTEAEAAALTGLDQLYLKWLRDPSPLASLPACLAFSPAHLHIDILPSAQRQGWGKRLIAAVAHELLSRGVNGVWVGMDPRNVEARKFYERIGFEPIQGAPDSCMGLKCAKLAES